MRKLKILSTALLLISFLLSGCQPQTATPTPTPSAQTDLLSQGDFVVRLVEALELELDDVVVEYGDELYSLEVSMEGTDVFTIYSDNAYAEYQLTPDNLEGLLEYFVSSVAEILRDSLVVPSLDNVYPLMKEAGYMEMLGEYGEGMVYELFDDLMTIVYVVDSPTSVRMLTEDELTELGLDMADLREQALANLRAREIYYDMDVDVYYPSTDEIVYTASLVLLDIWNSENFAVKGDLIVGVPQRDILIVIGSEDQELVDELRDFCEQQYDASGYPVYRGLLRYNGSGFEPY